MDMNQLMQGLLAGPTPEDRSKAMNMGLLAAGLGLLARKNLGEAGLLGMQSGMSAMDAANKERMQKFQSAALLPQIQKSILDAEKAKTAADFYSPENGQRFMEGAIPEPPAELGGGPGRAGTMNFERFLNEGASRGVIDPEKLIQHRALETQRRDALAQQMQLSRERLEQAAQLQRERIEQQRLEAERRSEDRRFAVDSANDRARERLDFQRGADDRARRGLLKPGERFNESGQIEVIPGSTEYVKRSNAHSKDLQIVQLTDNKTDNAIRKLDQILDDKNKVGFERNFGGYNALITQKFPDALNTSAIIESLKSDMKAAGLEMMRVGGSIGAMTEREWPIVERAIANITPLMSEAEARKQLTEVRAHIDRIRTIARDAYDNEWSGSQFHRGAKPGSTPGAAAPQTGAKTMTMADVAVTAKAQGITERQVIERARSMGYEVR